jgi:hypothetical protein
MSSYKSLIAEKKVEYFISETREKIRLKWSIECEPVRVMTKTKGNIEVIGVSGEIGEDCTIATRRK